MYTWVNCWAKVTDFWEICKFVCVMSDSTGKPNCWQFHFDYLLWLEQTKTFCLKCWHWNQTDICCIFGTSMLSLLCLQLSLHVMIHQWSTHFPTILSTPTTPIAFNWISRKNRAAAAAADADAKQEDVNTICGGSHCFKGEGINIEMNNCQHLDCTNCFKNVFSFVITAKNAPGIFKSNNLNCLRCLLYLKQQSGLQLILCTQRSRNWLVLITPGDNMF